MAGSFAAALLDELMGRNRNKHPEGQRKTHWSDPEVMYFRILIHNFVFKVLRLRESGSNLLHHRQYQ